MSDRDKAIEAAADAMLKAEQWSDFWSREDATILCRAAIAAFLEAWEPSEEAYLRAIEASGLFTKQLRVAARVEASRLRGGSR